MKPRPKDSFGDACSFFKIENVVLFTFNFVCIENKNTPMFTSGFVDWVYTDLKI